MAAACYIDLPFSWYFLDNDAAVGVYLFGIHFVYRQENVCIAMAGIAITVLWRFELNVVRGSETPRGGIVKIGHEVFPIVSEALRVYRDVPQGHVLVRISLILQGVAAN